MDRQKRILIADDEWINRRMLKVIFGEDYDIVEAENGQQVLDILASSMQPFDLLLLDLRMPLVDGFAVLSHLRSNGMLTDLPVIVITASSEVEDELRAYHSGAVDTVRKPFVPEVIMLKARNLIELYARRQELDRKLAYSRSHDTLTGLFNAREFYARVDALLQNMDAESSRKYAIVYGNICNFRYYNVQNGTEMGDAVLQDMADYIVQVTGNALSARMGQDHFITITDSPDLPDWIEQVTLGFAKAYGHTGMHWKSGIYRIRRPEENASAACEMAKMACDSIRSSSRTVCEYTDDLAHEIDISTYVLQNLDTALEKGYIQVYFQPVIRTINGKTCGMEALARWIDPNKGFLSPADFIPVLEENRLINKLDLYMLRQVCEGLAEFSAQGKATVPISFNLSRVDFETCDICSEVDKIVMSCGVPRDMINIEITESAAIKNPELIRKGLDDFHAYGYQVWMDDFGSGYSSLNVLKEYSFDEIKLDMKFMSSFDERSKEVITSIIAMAKKIGVQTLAEGVETQEQYDFLRYIGCEKVQGYWFSKPRSVEELLKMKLTKPECVEQRAWRKYYNRIGETNFVTDRALAIAEYDEKMITLCYVNQAFRKVLEETGASDLNVVYENINAPSSPLSHQFRDLRENCHVGSGEQEIVYTIRGQYIRLRVKCLAEYAHKGAFELEIFGMTSFEEKRKRIDYVYREMHALFDMVCRIDMNREEIEFLRQGDFADLPEHKQNHSVRTYRETREAAVSLIHSRDREEYLQFTDLHTLRARVEEEGKGYITGFFRTRTWNGAYIWKAHTVLYLAESNTAIYCTRVAPVSNHGFIQRILPEFGLRQDGAQPSGFMKFIRKGILESKTVNIFWKDTKRRFVGANEQFLRTYGFRDISEIVGKTDEDMQWHIEEGPFADDEWRVLNRGEVITSRIGRCIIKGVVHNILVAKEPLYDNGSIVGLIGYFANIDDLNENLDWMDSVVVKDHITGLMSPQGLINAMSQYAEEWQIRHKNFAMIRITISEFYRATMHYGESTADTMLRSIGESIAKVAGTKGTCARLFAGNFIVLLRYQAKAEAEQVAQEIRQHLESIRELAGFAETIHPQIEITYSEEERDVRTMLGVISGGALIDIEERESQRTNLDLVWNTYENMDDIVYAADMDTYDLIFMNRYARETCGMSSIDQIKGRKCYELIQGNSAPCSFCTNKYLLNGKPYEWEFLNQQFGSLYRLRDQMIVHNGRRIRIEHAEEVTAKREEGVDTARQRMALLISESMRLALEEADPNEGICSLLRNLGSSLSCERSYIFEMTPQSTWNNTYEWCAKGVSQEKDNLQNIPIEDTRLWNKELSRGNYIMIQDINDTKEENPDVYAYLYPQNIQSLIVAPIYMNDELYGFAGFDNPPRDGFEEIARQIKTIMHVMETLLVKRDLKIEMDSLSYRDSLSNLGNRHAVKRFFAEVDRSQSLGIAFCDVCGLKTVNDTLSHAAGDQLLLQTSDMLRSIFGEYMIFRWGGDEMLVLASGIEEEVFYQKCKDLEKLSLQECAPLAVGSIWKSESMDVWEDLIKEADNAMYNNKQKMYSRSDVRSILMHNQHLRHFSGGGSLE